MKSKRYKVKANNKFRLGLIAILALVFCVILPLEPAFAQVVNSTGPKEEERQTIRVGWFDFPGMAEDMGNGNFRGYYHEYVDKLAKYASLNVVYVHGEWTELESMLRRGDIDLLGYVSHTHERESLYDYLDYAMGTESCCLIAPMSREDLDTGDIKHMAGKTIALFHSSYWLNTLLSLKETEGIDFNILTCESMEECKAAVDKGVADAIFTSSNITFTGYKLLYEFPVEPYFLAVSKKRPDLLEALNKAARALHASNPDFVTNLQKKYFYLTVGNGINVPFTEEEKEYIAHHSVIRVGAIANSYPFVFTDRAGKMAGFVPYYIDLLTKQSGLEFVITYYDAYDDMLTALIDGEVDLALQFPDDFDYAHQLGLTITAPYIKVPQGLLSIEGNTATRIATLDGTFMGKYGNSAKYETVYCDSQDDCVTNLIMGNADAVITNIYTYQRYTEIYPNIKFVFSGITPSERSYSIAMKENCEPIFLSVLEKSILNITPSATLDLLANTVSGRYRFSLIRWVKNNYRVILLTLLAILIFVGGVTFMLKYRILKLQRSTNERLSRANSELKRANEAKSEFLSRTSHDLRTPMNAIIGLTALALDEPETSQKDFYLSEIATSGEFLLGLINDVLDMEKIEAGFVTLTPSAYKYKDFCNMLNTMVQPLCHKKKQDFIFEPSDFDGTLYVDHTRFNQIFFNLLSNAVKYTPDNGTVIFELSKNTIEGNIASMDFIIADTGKGMSEEFLEHMYEPFAQERQSDSMGSGTGLGLAIVKTLVDIMGGSIKVQSRIDEGTIFLVHLDIPLTTEEETEDKAIEPGAIDALLKGKNVLLVDDQALNLQVAKKILEKKGMNVTVANDGSEALNTFVASKECFFDAILMDIRMPILNGHDAAKAIRALDRKDASVVPIIAMTANTFDEDKERSKEAGMNAHLGKPIVPKELFEALYRQILANSIEDMR